MDDKKFKILTTDILDLEIENDLSIDQELDYDGPNIFKELLWQPNQIFPKDPIIQDQIILKRLKYDYDDITIISKGSELKTILSNWEKKLNKRPFNVNWVNENRTKRLESIPFHSSDLITFINFMYNDHSNIFYKQNLGYLAEAILLKYLFNVPQNKGSNFYRLPTFALFDLYEPATRSFIDIKHTTMDQYKYHQRFLNNRRKIMNEFLNIEGPDNYNFYIWPTKIKEIKDDKVVIELDEIKSFNAITAAHSTTKKKAA